jgi:hypothetical protein
MVLPMVFWGLQLVSPRVVDGQLRHMEDSRLQLMLAPPAVLLIACAASALPGMGAWPLPYGLGGFLGDQTLRFVGRLLGAATPTYATPAAGILCLAAGSLLLTASLGMSLRDAWLLCQVRWPRVQTIASTWRRLTRVGERAEPVYTRREPTFETADGAHTGRRQPPFTVEPAFDFDPPVRRTADPAPAPTRKSLHLRRPIEREAEFDHATDAASQEMAKRFAPPPREEPSGPTGLGLFRRHWAQPGGTGERPASGEQQPERKPVWPGSVPVPSGEDAAPGGPDGRSEEEIYYRRAVALVRAHGKVSTTDLRQTLRIRYLLAAHLIDRMEREGIVGAHGRRTVARPRIV